MHKILFVALYVHFCLASPTSKGKQTFELQLIHNNDMHARFEETSRFSGVCDKADLGRTCIGGFARVVHIIRKARKEAEEGLRPPVLYLNAGDTYTGTAWFSLHRWDIATDFMNELRPDAVSLGNHEFDLGIEGLVPFIRKAAFPILAANLDLSDQPQLQFAGIQKSKILNIAGHKIGVIGYVTPETRYLSHSENVIFHDEVESIRKESELLHEMGVHIVIAVGHSGYEMDKKIAREVPLVDVVVGGHSNTFLHSGDKIDLEEPEGPYPTIVRQSGGKVVPVVQAYAYTKYMGFLNLTIDEDGNVVKFAGHPLYLDSSIPQEEDILRKLDKYRAEVEELDTKIVGRSKVVLEGDVACRQHECNFGNLIADSFVAYHLNKYKGTYWTDTPIAIMNGGSIRTSIQPRSDGKISKSELLSALPFYSPLMSLSMNGSGIWETFEIAARSNGETSRGEFLQVSGVKVVYDLSGPVGRRVQSIEVRCTFCEVPTYEPIVLDKTYRLITTVFLIDGGDGHNVLHDKSFDRVTERTNDLEAVELYMAKHSPIYPEMQGRITLLPVNSGSSSSVNRIPFILTFISLLIVCY